MRAIVCGWCKAFSQVSLISKVSIIETINEGPFDGVWKVQAAFVCLSCNHISVATWITNTDPSKIQGDAAISWMTNKKRVGSVNWVPLRGTQKEFPDVPNHIAEAAKEAWTCFSAQCYRASVMIARVVIEATANESGFKKGNLQQKILKLSEEGKIRRDVVDQANEIRLFGNIGAHGSVEEEILELEVEEILTLMEEVLNEVWQAPARADRLRTRREQRNK